jgi:acyl dehydratase
VVSVAGRDTPVGYELDGVKKRIVVQLMGSRAWGRVSPLHWDPVTAALHGLKAPIQSGTLSSAYLSETCVNFFGAAFFRNATIEGRYVKPIYAGEIITTRGVVRERIPEEGGVRLTVELWAENEEGEVKTVSTATAHVD